MKLRNILLSSFAVLMCSITANRADACTNVIVTKGASADGSCMVSYAADSHWLYGELYFKPQADWKVTDKLRVYDWDSGQYLGLIDQVEHTYKTVGNMNEHQLIIAETTFGGRHGLNDPNGIMDYGSLIYITLQRARTAREAIKVMAELTNKYGYFSEGESFSIVDKNEAWIMEMVGKGIISGELNSAIYIAPTRALVNEITQKFIIKTLPYQNEVRVTSIPTINNEYNKQIFVLTQERLQVLLDNFEEKIDLVVIDEAQSISDEIRGMILQDCLDKISTQNPNAKYVFLAPGAEGFDDLADIIGIDAIHIEKTNLSPVVQNKIIVKVDPSKENNLQLSLLDNSDILPIGEIESTRGFANENTRLAAVALELGKNEGSLVYGTGAENAEDVAKQISSGLPLLEDDSELQELSKFIKKHVHEDYSLANLVLRGVGYHYGKMPSLLRETLEKNFTNNKLKFLVCTTTLFQGVNLPAKNVFIDTPTRGNRGEKLDPASLWNFAGRAGRLGYAFSGNVYLIDYDDWVTKPLDSKIDFKITSSLKKVINEDFDTVISRLDKNNHSGVTPYSNIDAAAGLLISRAAKGDLHNFLKRSFRTLSDKSKLETIDNATYISLESLKIPHEVLTLNWTVDPFGQERLYNRFIQKIKEGKVDELIPRHPSGDVYKNYVGVFSRINKYILNHNTSKFSNYLTSIALNWMRGKSLPEIISLSINKKKEKNPLGL